MPEKWVNFRKNTEQKWKYQEDCGNFRKNPINLGKKVEICGKMRKFSGKIPYISGDSDARESESREICEKKGGFHGIQTLESPKVEGLVKKRGISRDSDTRESESRGICEKKRVIPLRITSIQVISIRLQANSKIF